MPLSNINELEARLHPPGSSLYFQEQGVAKYPMIDLLIEPPTEESSLAAPASTAGVGDLVRVYLRDLRRIPLLTH